MAGFAFLPGIGLDLEATEDPERAGFILNVGVDAARRSFESYEQVLRRAHRRGLPMICANPDLETPDGKRLLYGAGALASRYAEWGGHVTWFGKPHPEIFAAAIEALERSRGARVVVIGDSLIHDVAGAWAVGLDSAFVLDGVHGPELARGGTTEDAVGALCARIGVEPDFVLPTLKW